MGKMKRRVAVGALALTSICLSFIGLEVLVRAFIFDPNHSYIRTPGWQMEVRTNDLLPNVSGDHVFLANSYGFRGELPGLNSKPKIAVLGGSTAEDWVLEYSETWAQQLAKNLADCAPKAWVANLGKSGVNARHHLIQLPEVTQYLPRFDIFVVLLGLNDFLFDLRIHHPFEIAPEWWQQQALMFRAGDEGWLATVAILKRLYNAFSSNHKAISDFGVYQESLRVAYRKVLEDQWVNDMPDLTEHLARYEGTVLSLKKYADDYGARIVFITQPFLWDDQMSEVAKSMIYSGFIGSDMNGRHAKWYTPRAMEAGLSAYNDRLRAICRRENLACIDAERLLGRDVGNFYDDFHFSELGARRLGALVAGAVKSEIKACTR